MTMSNSELLLRKMAGEDVDISELTPTCRFDEICLSIINNTPYDKAPQSIMEMLLLEIKEHGGGGGDKPTGTIEINQNGSVNVSKYAMANVSVPQGVFPEGTLSITENGTYDVTEKENVSVNVEGGSEDWQIENAAFLFSGAKNPISSVSKIGGQLRYEKSFNNLKPHLQNIRTAYNMFSNYTEPNTQTFYDCHENGANMLDYSNCTSMENMFYNSQSSKIINVSDFNTSNVKSMYSMFHLNKALLYLDASNFDFSNVEIVTSMFSSCEKIKWIKLGTPTTSFSKIKNSDYMFNDCKNLEKIVFGGISLFRLTASNCLKNVPLTCEFYVPDNLVDAYKAATNWALRGDYIKPISEYVE